MAVVWNPGLVLPLVVRYRHNSDSCSSIVERGGELEVAEQMSGGKKTSSCAGHHLLKDHPVTDKTADHHLKHFIPHKKQLTPRYV